MRVASYNIRKAIGTDRLRRPERILAVLAEIDADIVAVQEADRRVGRRTAALSSSLLAERSPYVEANVAVRADSIGWHGNALLVRRGLHIAGVRRIALPTLEPRGTVAAEVSVGGKMVRIVGMHLDLSGLRRRQQAHAILHALAALPPLPTVMMGDTNEWRAHGGCLHDFAHRFAIVPTGPSYHSRRPIARLDRIMVEGMAVIACGTHRSLTATRASDHLPIWADVALD